jgi:hypothetical protein
MKFILVYGDSNDEILDKIYVETVPDIIVWKNQEYRIWNTDLGFLINPPDNKKINDYKGTFFFFYDQ